MICFLALRLETVKKLVAVIFLNFRIEFLICKLSRCFLKITDKKNSQFCFRIGSFTFYSIRKHST